MTDPLDWHLRNCAALMAREMDEAIMLGYVTPQTQASIDFWNAKAVEWAKEDGRWEDDDD